MALVRYTYITLMLRVNIERLPKVFCGAILLILKMLTKEIPRSNDTFILYYNSNSKYQGKYQGALLKKSFFQ